MDKLNTCKKLHANILFVGDDWHGTEKWKTYEKELKQEGISIIYFPRIKNHSSTELIQKCVENSKNTEEDRRLFI